MSGGDYNGKDNIFQGWCLVAYEIFATTADVGLKIEGNDWQENYL